MKMKRSYKRGYGAFIDTKLLNTILMIALVFLLIGPIVFLGSIIMKIIAFILLINILPSLFTGNTKNLGFKTLLTVILILILFKRAYFIPIAIIIGLVLLKNLKIEPKKREGTYRFTNSNNSYSNTKRDYSQNTTSFNEPRDPFSYRKRESEIIDVEYEDWEAEPKSQTYTNPNVNSKRSMDYSYSGSISKDEEGSAEESEADCLDNSRAYENENEHNKQKVYIGSITKTIHQDSLNVGDNELSFICKLGDLNLIVDSRLETEISCSIKAGEIRIGDESYNGINQKVKRSWSPTLASNKKLKLNCEVGLGEIRIRHKKLY